MPLGNSDRSKREQRSMYCPLELSCQASGAHTSVALAVSCRDKDVRHVRALIIGPFARISGISIVIRFLIMMQTGYALPIRLF